jgi:hypothetical protein
MRRVDELSLNAYGGNAMTSDDADTFKDSTLGRKDALTVQDLLSGIVPEGADAGARCLPQFRDRRQQHGGASRPAAPVPKRRCKSSRWKA